MIITNMNMTITTMNVTKVISAKVFASNKCCVQPTSATAIHGGQILGRMRDAS